MTETITTNQISERNITLLNLHSIGISAIFVLPVLLLYYQDVIGIGFRELLIGEALFAAVVVLMEVPSGWLSDVWKRKYVLILGSATNLIGFSLLWFADSFFDTCVAQALLGVGVSLTSGTIQALLYDTLLDANRENEFAQREGKRFSYGFYSIAVASMIGGFAYSISPHLAMGMTGIGYGFAVVASIFLIEPHRHKQAVKKHPIADIIETMRYALHGHREVARLIFVSAVMFCGTKILLWSQQPYYIANGIAPEWFGVLAAVGFVISGISGQLNHKIPGRFHNRHILGGLLAFEIAIFVIAGLFIGWVGIALILSGYVIYGLGQVRMHDALNKRVDSTRRATILSTAGLMTQMLSIPTLAAFGILVEDIGIGPTMVGMGAFTAILGWPLMARLIRADKSSERVAHNTTT